MHYYFCAFHQSNHSQLVFESIIATRLASLKLNNFILRYGALETGQQIFDPPLIKVVKNCNALSRLIRLMLET